MWIGSFFLPISGMMHSLLQNWILFHTRFNAQNLNPQWEMIFCIHCHSWSWHVLCFVAVFHWLNWPVIGLIDYYMKLLGGLLVSLHPPLCPPIPHVVSSLWLFAYFVVCIHMWLKYNPWGVDVLHTISSSKVKVTWVVWIFVDGAGILDLQSTIYSFHIHSGIQCMCILDCWP